MLLARPVNFIRKKIKVSKNLSSEMFVDWPSHRIWLAQLPNLARKPDLTTANPTNPNLTIYKNYMFPTKFPMKSTIN